MTCPEYLKVYLYTCAEPMVHQCTDLMPVYVSCLTWNHPHIKHQKSSLAEVELSFTALTAGKTAGHRSAGNAHAESND